MTGVQTCALPIYIDYGFAEADTTYGKVGVKAWIYNGEILPTKGTKEGSDK